MRRAAVLILMVLAGLACSGERDVRPNVLLIIIDTLRADRVSCYGAKNVRTPVLDRLAVEGTRFDAAVSQASSTLPSICSILTSLYPYQHQVRDNDMDLREDVTTIAEVFRDARYRTGAVVGSALLDRERGLTQGFDHYEDDFPDSMNVFNRSLRQARIGPGRHSERRASNVTDRALSWILASTEGPFFMMVHYFDPHSLYDPPPPFDVEYAGKPYEGEVAYTDSQIGRLLAGLSEAGIRKNTIVLVIANHGEGLGDHFEPQHGFFVYDTTVRVPFLISYPAAFEGGVVVNRTVQSIDVLPTLADICGLTLRGYIAGRSLVPALRGEDIREAPAYSEALRGYFGYGWSPVRGIRTEVWKFVDAPRKELYYLDNDPLELDNIYEPGHVVGKVLEEIMNSRMRHERAQPDRGTGIGQLDEEQFRRLEALVDVPWAGNDLPDPKDEMEAFNNRLQANLIANLAHPHIEAGEFEKAREFLDGALLMDPNSLVAVENLARIHLIAGRGKEAEELFTRAIRLDTENLEHKANLAASLMVQNRFHEAVKLLAECVENEPSNEHYLRAYGAAREAAGLPR